MTACAEVPESRKRPKLAHPQDETEMMHEQTDHQFLRNTNSHQLTTTDSGLHIPPPQPVVTLRYFLIPARFNSSSEMETMNPSDFHKTLRTKIVQISQECGGSFANPDVYTSAGLVANGYARFRTHFWIDRALVWLTVLIPVVEALGLIALHAILGVARCVPKTMQAEADTRHMKDFFDRACGLQLTSNVLKGDVYQTELSSNLGTVQLQHECYPFILLMVAVAMWLPHYLYHRAVDKTARRDLCLVRSELHSFRRAVGQELNYLQAMSTASMEGVPTTALFSPGSTIPQAQTLPATVVRHATHAGPPAFMQQVPNSGRTTAATVGGTSLLSQTPAPTVIPALQPQTATMVTNRGALLPQAAADPSPTAPALNYGDADFSAPGLLDLPCFHACHADWSLNTYLSAWQNTDFYWRRYLAKHVVLATFQVDDTDPQLGFHLTRKMVNEVKEEKGPTDSGYEKQGSNYFQHFAKLGGFLNLPPE
ncbi:hypothetical protein X801_02846, partial [Opisthorchis viverrini]